MTAARLSGLDDTATQRVIGAARALALGRAEQAAAQLELARQRYPEHPEILRLHAGILNLHGDYNGARQAMERAVALRPLDALYHNTLATILGSAGDFDAAIRELRRACELDPALVTAWYNLGLMLVRSVRYEEAADALRRAVQLDPDNMAARAQLGEMLRVQGRDDEAVAEYRKVIAAQPWTGMAWWGLADLRTGALGADDIPRMDAALRDAHATDNDRIATGFALAMAFDEQGRYDEALGALKHANAIARLHQRWSATGFSRLVDTVNQAFAPPVAGAADPDLGREAIFIVGLPRSGTTLAEQILASHSEVEGVGELPDLALVLAEESRRLGKAYPAWVQGATPADWRRLGQRYLERTARWRHRRPRFTDKLPGNWIHIGAIRAMLPGAAIIVCRRDPLETCLSCYRQLLPPGNEWSRTPEDLAGFWRDFDRTVSHWAGVPSAPVYQHDYETLIAEPEAAIRHLLDACGLRFEDACLHFYASRRDVRSPSATQVRRPLQTDTARAPRYGNLLDPMRAALGLPTSGS
ncbi:MAG TPA: tetratricopeptide repeat protein [Rhodanobacteraceae bacterium]|nr:tetratricopeptide repeat protein [Rhodanobacteraceae bacterium]